MKKETSNLDHLIGVYVFIYVLTSRINRVKVIVKADFKFCYLMQFFTNSFLNLEILCHKEKNHAQNYLIRVPLNVFFYVKMI